MADEALKKDPQNREANRIIGSIYAAFAEQRRAIRPGESPQLYVARAIAALERARQDGPAELGLDLTLARLYLQTESFDKADPLLRRIVTQQPGYPDASLLLATAQDEMGQTAGGDRDADGDARRESEVLSRLRDARRAQREAGTVGTGGAGLRAGPAAEHSRPDLSTRRAAALINAGQGAAARDILRDPAAKAEPEPLVLYLYAAAQRLTGDLAGAEATARRLRTAAPEDPRGMYVLAQVLEARGDLEGAEEALRDLLKRDPKDATALNYLGYMFAERGQRLDEAVELVQRALKLEPENPSFLDSLGWAYFKQGKLDLADAPLTTAASKMPNNSVVQDHLGDLRFQQRRYADAAAAWERSLAGDGESIDRPRILKKIQDAKSRMEAR